MSTAGAGRFDAPRTAGQLAEWIGASCEGDASRLVYGVAQLDVADQTQLAFCSGGRWLAVLQQCSAGVVLMGRGDAPQGVVVLRHADPRRAFAKLLHDLFPLPEPVPEVHPTAVVHPTARVAGARIDAYAVVEERAVVGAGSWVQSHAYVGPGVQVGEACRLMPHAVVMAGSVLGDRVQLYPGAVIGADGFGHVSTEDGPLRVPHLGGTVIADDVEVGANACVDRAALGNTEIGRGTRLDNLVQVAHGATLGKSCLLAAFSGVAGGASLGDGVLMGGRAAVVDGIRVGDGAVFAGLASASKDVPAGRRLGGSPARRYNQWLREFAALRDLPTALRTMDKLERRVRALEESDPETS